MMTNSMKCGTRIFRCTNFSKTDLNLFNLIVINKMSDLTTQISNVEMLLAFLKNQLPKEELSEDKPKKKVVDEDKPKKKKVVEKKDAEVVSKKEEEKPVEKKKADPKKEKNLNRFTPAMKTELTKVLKAHDVELTEELRKEFIDHLNSLETEEYTKLSLTAHMEVFAKSKGKTEEKEEEPPAKVGGSPFAGQDDPPDLSKLSNAHGYDLSKLQKNRSSEQIAEFKKTEILKPLGDGNYWHAKSGMWYFEDGDEDVDEVQFEGKTYAVNKISKRVYETVGEKDLFVGFLGIGPFKKMKV